LLSRAAFKQKERTNLALARRGVIRVAARLPYGVVHRLIVSAIRAETWLRYPLWALNVSDAMKETFDELDPDGGLFGLSEKVRRRYRDNFFYNEIADLVTLFMYSDDERFQSKAMRVENEDALRDAIREEPGAIVAGFRLGSYVGLPWALGRFGVPVLMIVGDDAFARMARELGDAFAPESSATLKFVRAKDPLVLAKSQAVLNEGGIVSTLIDLSPIEYEKTTEVELLGKKLNVAYGLPYLAAVTGRKIVPAALTRAKGPRFKLRFGTPLEPPARDSASVRAGAQRLYDELGRMVLRFPDQWIGWQTLRGSGAGSDGANAAAGLALT
jgi:lauroyl/myristoyl acyltransferase